MDYFKLLNLGREPFSNSPDPDFFAHSKEHVGCLQKIELSLRLHRGLSVVIGDVGAGKTTLCRQLIRRFAGDEGVDTHLILDPDFSSPSEFLTYVAEMFEGHPPQGDLSDWQLKEMIKNNLFDRGVDEEKTVILIIDEGQKLPDFCLEILREFLNYETNEYKLLQIVIFAQREFDQYLKAHQNFADRINLYHQLRPLGFSETRSMIQFRLERASGGDQIPSFFSYPALWLIYRATGGYPRKIVNLCHRIMLNMIIEKRSKARWSMVRATVKKVFPEKARRWHLVRVGVLSGLLVVLVWVAWGSKVTSILGLRERQTDHAVSQVIRGQIQPRPFSTQRALHQGVSKKITPPPPVEIAQAPAESSTGMPHGEGEGQQITEPQMVAPMAEPGPQDEPQGGPQEQEAEKEPVDIPGPGPQGQMEKDAQGNAIGLEQHMPKAPEEKVAVSRPEPPAQEPEKEFPEVSRPEFLGRIQVNEHEWLAEMIRKVYGVYTRDYLDMIMAANPKIADPDVINPGQEIAFPAVSVSAKPSSPDSWWVEVAQKENLEEAYRFLKAYSSDEVPLDLISCWHRQQGLKFIITLGGQFASKRAAKRGLNRLPKEIASNARVVNQWGEDMVFFASAAFGK